MCERNGGTKMNAPTNGRPDRPESTRRFLCDGCGWSFLEVDAHPLFASLLCPDCAKQALQDGLDDGILEPFDR
jgi:hypothetical protein